MAGPLPITSGSPTEDSPALGLLELGFLTKAGGPSPALAMTPEKPGDAIGRYRLLAPLGQGGFGCVWRAEQTEPIHRELALKLIKPGMDSCEIIARFEAERQALALMDHPNIAGVLDAGTTATLRPYFVMELVKGEPITEYCDHHQLGLRERLELFVPVCQAVQHAHQKSILHRDLKPSNILVATVDGRPVPKVIDFGIAKALGGGEGALHDSMLRTQLGTAIGTPRYMSPEQAGSMPDVDTRSDVYSLGVILCELLSGQPPVPAQPTAFADALRWVREADPVKPSTLVQNMTLEVERAAEQRKVDPARFSRTLRGDLDWIILKALEKDRTRRYDSAVSLSRDIQRHLSQEPVSAVAPTWRYQLGKFARRQRLALFTTGLIAVALIAGTIVSLWQASRAERNRLEAEEHFAQARDAVDQYLSRVTNHPKLKQANFIDLQRDLLETALPFYEKMSANQGEDAKLRSDRAWAMWRLARLYQNMGQFAKSEATFHEATRIQERLVAEFPHEPQRQMDLAFLLNERAYVQRMQNKPDECLESYAKAVSLQEELVAKQPDNPDLQHGLSVVMMNQAISQDALKAPEKALNSYGKAGAILKRLIQRYPNSVLYWSTTGNCLGSLGVLQFRRGHLKDAELALTQAVECQEQAILSDLRNRDYRHALGNSLTNLGRLLLKQNRLDESEAQLRRATEMLRRLVDEFSTVSNYRAALADALESLALCLTQNGKAKEAEKWEEQLDKERTQLAAEFPDDKRYAEDELKTYALQAGRAFERRQWDTARDRYERVAALRPDSDTHLRLCQIALETKDHAGLLKHAVEFARLSPSTWQSQESAAQFLCDALPMIESDVSLEPAARRAQLDACVGQICGLLKQAITRGFTGMAHLQSADRNRPLRERPEFLALINAVGTPPPLAPRRFSYDYIFDDPGPRSWVRDGLMWKETQPSGLVNTFVIAGEMELKGIPGTELRKLGPESLTLFVPNVGTALPTKLMMRKADGTWTPIGTLTSME